MYYHIEMVERGRVGGHVASDISKTPLGFLYVDTSLPRLTGNQLQQHLSETL